MVFAVGTLQAPIRLTLYVPESAFVRFGLILSFALLTVAGAMVILSAAQDLQARDAAPEAVVRRYFAALEAGDLDGALQANAPAGRAGSTDFVANLLGN